MARGRKHPPFECIALTLQGGGALGAYQAGVYQALAEADIHPDWVAGISIGSINAAIIAGNPREARVGKLQGFWDTITSTPGFDAFSSLGRYLMAGDESRRLADQMSAATALTMGVTGFFQPRLVPPFLEPSGSPAATSFYDTGPLRETLERFVDFDRINAKETRLSVGAVNVETGNFVYFDFDEVQDRTGARHGEWRAAARTFPPSRSTASTIGMAASSPIRRCNGCCNSARGATRWCFEVDLWSARGPFPHGIMDVATREKEIRFSSRTRDNTDRFVDIQRLRHAAAKLIEELPQRRKPHAELEALRNFADHKVYSIVHLIYRSKNYEGEAKDFEFSALSMRDHWTAGYRDTVATLTHPGVLERPKNADGVAIFDCATFNPG